MWLIRVIKHRYIRAHGVFGGFITMLIIVSLSPHAYGQGKSITDTLLRIKENTDAESVEQQAEKLYIQFDKLHYEQGDTIWFKAYLLNRVNLLPSKKSVIFYADIINAKKKILNRYRFPVVNGVSWGNISLNHSFPPGIYTLRAYTNLMRNFGDEALFYKQFSIVSAGGNSIVANVTSTLTEEKGARYANIHLNFSELNRKPYALKELLFQIASGNRYLFKQRLQTGVNGAVEIKINLAGDAGYLTATVINEESNQQMVVPILLKKSSNIDLQFFPEGGELVGSLPAHIAFKALGNDGKGVYVSGVIINKEKKRIADFRSEKNGMGSFDMDVKADESYSARVISPDGTTHLFSLPVVKSTGTILQVKKIAGSDSLKLLIMKKDNKSNANHCFLLATSRGIVCYAAIIQLDSVGFLSKKISGKLFPTGIVHFLLTTSKQQPLNERLFFVNHNDELNIGINSDKTFYDVKSPIPVQLKVKDALGSPITGSFSMAVTDDQTVKAETFTKENIISRFLLTSDLKGFVEEPGYYFSSKSDSTIRHLDNLLLTQGWVNYNNQNNKLQFEAENEFKITGNVLNVFNKPVKATHVMLFAKNPAVLMDTITDNMGKFSFRHFPHIDSPIFIIKAVNKNGKSFNVSVKVDELSPPSIPDQILPVNPDWCVNTDSVMLNYINKSINGRADQSIPIGSHLLRGVTIKSSKIIKDSKNLFGPGNSDFAMDEAALEKQGKKTILDVLKEKIIGFRQGTYTIFHPGYEAKTINWYFVRDQWISIFVDGQNLLKIMQIGIDDFKDLADYLGSHTAEDIKGIEMKSVGEVAYIEITTRSGHGPVINNTPGVYLYKPLPFSWPKQFYKPKYTVKDTTADFRSTIDWEPNIVTDKNGEATISFYAADKPTTYTVIIEGTDLNGNLGYKMQKIKIEKAR